MEFLHRKTTTWLNMVVGILFLLVGAGIIFSVNWAMKEHALLEAKEKALILLERNLATHEYFAEQLKPSVFPLSETRIAEGYFEPRWMSSTFAIRNIDQLFQKYSKHRYYHKECAINARSPENEAEGYEIDFIKQLNADPTLIERTEIRSIEGEPFLVVLRRGESMSKGCLRCHSTPDEAPSGMVEYYGPTRSFGRKLGEVVSAVSIRIPLEHAYGEANQLSLHLSAVLTLALALLFIVQTLLGRTLIQRPLHTLIRFIKKIHIGKEEGREHALVMTHGGSEVRELTDAFNAMLQENHRKQREILDLNLHLENKVRERTQRLTAANQELEAFTYAVSHDLRAPLRAMDGFSEALLEDYNEQLDEEGKQYLRFLQQSSTEMAGLIDGLLRLSRATRGEVLLQPVDLTALAEEVAGALARSEPDRQVTWNIAPALTAHGDLRLLKTLLENLMGNAWKYTGRTQGARIDFSASVQEGQQIYTVRDNGAGFDMAYADKLFQPFQRLHGEAEFAGSGIGLATVQRIVHRHGGRIWAEGTVAQGAAFHFTLASANK